MASNTSLEERLNNICLEESNKEQNPIIDEKWGLPLKEIYRLALNFYKEKSGKAIHLSYEDNLKMIAYTQQAVNGPYSTLPSTHPAHSLGVLDVIGRDRRLAWQNLGDLTKSEAMESFINLLNSLCGSFKPYMEAIMKDKEERLKLELERKRKNQEAMEKEKKILDAQKQTEEQRYKEELQRRQLQDALNQQTYHQFKAYAEKQFPGNPEQQAVLIRQLQNEHYHQYMQQLHAQIRITTATGQGNNISQIHEQGLKLLQRKNDGGENSTELQSNDLQESTRSEQKDGDNKSELDNSESIIGCGGGDDSGEYLVISPAKMWTRPDIKVFKKEVSAGTGDGVINIGHGDTVTVRVPTHEGGSSIFWEFATDSYDIGFGVYFEWSKPVTNEVTVHISESDEEDEYYDEDDEDYTTTGDLECGPVQTHRSSVSPNRPPISIIVPVYRRECQTEVYIGSHSYPGEGVYLLKFDNSFSIWRSKTLYYRVYYER